MTPVTPAQMRIDLTTAYDQYVYGLLEPIGNKLDLNLSPYDIKIPN